MRFHGVIQEVMGSKSQIAILTTLLKYPGKVFSGREISRLTGVSKTRTAEIMLDFEKNNIVNKKTIGITNEWSVNQESALVVYLTKHFLELDARIFASLKNDIKSHFRDAEGVSKVVLFGSVARGDETHYSDIDLLVLLKKPEKKKVQKKVDELNLLVAAKYGNPVSANIYTETEFKKETLAVELKERIKNEGVFLLER